MSSFSLVIRVIGVAGPPEGKAQVMRQKGRKGQNKKERRNTGI